MHSPLHPRQVAEVAAVDLRIQAEYDRGDDGLLSRDRHLFRGPVTNRFQLLLGHKVQWLRSVSFARDRSSRPTPVTQNASRRLMRQWLSPGTSLVE